MYFWQIKEIIVSAPRHKGQSARSSTTAPLPYWPSSRITALTRWETLRFHIALIIERAGAVPRDNRRCPPGVLRRPAIGAYGLAKQWCASGRLPSLAPRIARGADRIKRRGAGGPRSAGGRVGGPLDASHRHQRSASARHTDRKRHLVLSFVRGRASRSSRNSVRKASTRLGPEQQENDSGSSEQAVGRVRTAP